MVDIRPVGVDSKGRLRRIDPASDRLTVGSLLRVLGDMVFEDEFAVPVSLTDLLAGSLTIRQNAPMVGDIDGVNKVFVVPFGDKAIISSPGTTIAVKINGVDYLDGAGNDYTLSESGGVGTGFDTITLLHFAPSVGSNVTTTYFKTP